MVLFQIPLGCSHWFLSFTLLWCGAKYSARLCCFSSVGQNSCRCTCPSSDSDNESWEDPSLSPGSEHFEFHLRPTSTSSAGAAVMPLRVTTPLRSAGEVSDRPGPSRPAAFAYQTSDDVVFLGVSDMSPPAFGSATSRPITGDRRHHVSPEGHQESAESGTSATTSSTQQSPGRTGAAGARPGTSRRRRPGRRAGRDSPTPAAGENISLHEATQIVGQSTSTVSLSTVRSRFLHLRTQPYSNVADGRHVNRRARAGTVSLVPPLPFVQSVID